jgi:hypothetical protein
MSVVIVVGSDASKFVVFVTALVAAREHDHMAAIPASFISPVGLIAIRGAATIAPGMAAAATLGPQLVWVAPPPLETTWPRLVPLRLGRGSHRRHIPYVMSVRLVDTFGYLSPVPLLLSSDPLISYIVIPRPLMCPVSLATSISWSSSMIALTTR